MSVFMANSGLAFRAEWKQLRNGKEGRQGVNLLLPDSRELSSVSQAYLFWLL